MNVTVMQSSGGIPGAKPGWFADIVEAEKVKPQADIPSMLVVGCTEIRSTLNGAGGVGLIFVWSGPARSDSAAQARFVAWWAGKVPGMSQVAAASAIPSTLTDTVRYVPDIYGRPCVPPTTPGSTV